MLYNSIPDLASGQIITLLFIISLILVAIFSYRKIKLTKEIVLNSILIGSIFTFLSLTIVNGSYGGEAYHDRFGWPGQIYTMTRPLTNPEPYLFVFNYLKLFANILFYSGISLIFVSAFYKGRAKKK